MLISLIVAASANDVIGVGGELPWHLPDDFKHFKQTTMGKPVLMGRRTWESIGRALPGRQNIVITRQPDFDAPGATLAASPSDALAKALGAAEVMVIGGGQVYAMFSGVARRIYLTRVHTVIEGDTFFRTPDEAQWSLKTRDARTADDRHAYDYEFRVYDRL